MNRSEWIVCSTQALFILPQLVSIIIIPILSQVPFLSSFFQKSNQGLERRAYFFNVMQDCYSHSISVSFWQLALPGYGWDAMVG